MHCGEQLAFSSDVCAAIRIEWQPVPAPNQFLCQFHGPRLADYCDNAAPVRMFRISRVLPFTLPGILSVIGSIRIEGFLGQYSGQEFVYSPSGFVGQYGVSLANQPIVHGERISLKPTTNLEVGLSRTTDYGGPGYPVDLHNMLRSLFSTGNTFGGKSKQARVAPFRAGFQLSFSWPSPIS